MSSSKKPSFKEISSAKSREIPLEETIRKVLQSELKLIFPAYFFQDFTEGASSGPIVSKQIVVPMELKIKSPNNILLASKDSTPDESSIEEESLDDPIEIYFVQKKELKTSVATVKCKIKRLKITAITVDSGAEPPIITENIVERVGLKSINLKHMILAVESVGVVRKLPITLAPGCIIHEDEKYHKPTLYFPTNF